MKSFRNFIKEEVLPSVQVADGGLDISKPAVRAAINAAIAGVVSQPSVTPYVVFNRLSKLLAQYHIVLPRKFLEGDKGVEVFEIKQFGHKMGMTDSGEFINEVPSTHYLFMQYGILSPFGITYAKPIVGGMFKVTARLVDKAELDKLLDMAEISMNEEAECMQAIAKANAPKDPMHDITSDEKKKGNKAAVAASQQGLHESMSDDARELKTYADNHAGLHRSSHQPIVKNLERKHAKGTYDHEKAKKLWGYHAKRASDSYHKEFGHKFSKAHRDEAASHMADEARDDHGFGHVKESYQLDEISKELASRYIKRSAGYLVSGKKPFTRSLGIHVATDKLTGKAKVPANEETQVDEAKMTRSQKDMAVRRFMSHDPDAGERILAMGKKDREEKKSFASAKKEIKRLKEEEQIDETHADNIRRKYREKEDSNDHTGNVHLMTRVFGSKKERETSKEMLRKRDKQGYVSGSDSKRGYDMTKNYAHRMEKLKEEKNDLKGACWKGYTAKGLKKKGDRMVPNCVPVEESSKSMKGKFLNSVAKVEKQSKAAGDFYWNSHHHPKEVTKAKDDHARRVGLAKKVFKRYQSQVDEEQQIDERYHVVTSNYSLEPGKVGQRTSEDEVHSKHKSLKAAARKLTTVIGSKRASKYEILDTHTGKRMSRNQARDLVEQDQLDELKKSTLASYVKKASHDVGTNSAATGRYSDRANSALDKYKNGGDYKDWQEHEKNGAVASRAFNKSWKRRQGISKAVDKLVKEQQIDEISQKVKLSYLNKSHDESFPKGTQGTSPVKLSPRKKWNRAAGAIRATDPEGAKKMDLYKYQADRKLEEKLTKRMSAGDVIHDFVHSDDPKFKGKSNKERQKMALGAYYGMHKEGNLQELHGKGKLGDITKASYDKMQSHHLGHGHSENPHTHDVHRGNELRRIVKDDEWYKKNGGRGFKRSFKDFSQSQLHRSAKKEFQAKHGTNEELKFDPSTEVPKNT